MMTNSFKAFRHYFDYSKSELAKKLEVSTQWISDIEEKSEMPTSYSIIRYSQFFGVFMEDFALLSEALAFLAKQHNDNGVISDNDKSVALDTVKDLHQITQLVLMREMALLTKPNKKWHQGS